MSPDQTGDADLSSALATTPSFEGRLKLNQFLYASSENTGNSIRRSPRLNAPQPAISSPSKSPSKQIPRAPEGKSSKRKHGSPATITKSEAGTATSTTTPSPRKRSRQSSSYAPPSTYAHLPPLVDVLAPNLLILFVGLNPGIQTARSGHAYAHPSNLFWKLLYSSGITPVRCRAEEDRTLPERFALGNTNIVARPSRNGAELSKSEMDDGVAVLEAKVRACRPEVVCVVGKSIWESIWRVRRGKAITKAEFRYGWQDKSENMGVVSGAVADGDDDEQAEDDGISKAFAGAKVFVATSTSGLAASLRPEDKERIWKELGDWCKRRREERQENVN